MEESCVQTSVVEIQAVADDSHCLHCLKCCICVMTVKEKGPELSVNSTSPQKTIEIFSEEVKKHTNLEKEANIVEDVPNGVKDTSVELALDNVDPCIYTWESITKYGQSPLVVKDFEVELAHETHHEPSESSLKSVGYWTSVTSCGEKEKPSIAKTDVFADWTSLHSDCKSTIVFLVFIVVASYEAIEDVHNCSTVFVTECET